MLRIKMSYAKALLVYSVLLTGNRGHGQSFLNLDFEYGVEKGQPRKWSIEGEGMYYSGGLDTRMANNGTKSLYIKQKEAKDNTFLRIPGHDVAGKIIKIVANIRFDRKDSLVANLLIAQPGGPVFFSSKPASTKQKSWQLISSEAKIPNNFSADRLLVALTTSGTGKLWFDHVSITIDGKAYGNGRPDFREPTKKEIEILNKKAIPVAILDKEAANMTSFRNIIGDAGIVALGENSHGSSSIYKLKLQLIKTLVQKFGFTVFALEMPAAEADNLNLYVHDGVLDEATLIKNLAYQSWQTTEMLDILNWIRSYNQTKDRKVTFRGFDIQNTDLAFKKVNEFAKKHDNGLLVKLADLEERITRLAYAKQEWQTIYQKGDSICKYLDSKNASGYPGVNDTDFSTTRHYMRLCLNDLFMKYGSGKAKSRDEYMADNIQWIMESAPAGSKIIISADNTHVSKGTGKMGYYLDQTYGKKYLAWGFTFNEGTYAAYGKEKKYRVHPSYAGTAEYLFSKSQYKNFFLDLRNVDGLSILNQSVGFRSIGSKPQETTQFADITLREHFDLIAFISTSLHTVCLSE